MRSWLSPWVGSRPTDDYNQCVRRTFMNIQQTGSEQALVRADPPLGGPRTTIGHQMLCTSSCARWAICRDCADDAAASCG